MMPGPGDRNGTSIERRQRAEIEQLKLALAEATVQLRICGWGLSMFMRSLRRPRGPKSGGGNAGFEFAALAGIPERTYRRRLARLRAGDVGKGPWPAPRVDAIDALAAKYAADWPAWGHRKVAAMMRADGLAVSTSTVQRALRRRGLLLPRVPG
jgi:hypothetical protein